MKEIRAQQKSLKLSQALLNREFSDSSQSFQNRSWNEEFINFNVYRLKDAHVLEKVNQAKFGRRSQQEFLKNCQQLVEGISKGEIQSISTGGPGHERCYIRNSSFISVAKDNLDHWRSPQGDEDVANYSVVNADLRNLGEALKLGLSKTQFINTVLVDRLGTRFVVQNMVEGMLYFDPKGWGKYGTFDEGTSFQKTQDFDEIMREICERLWLTQENNFTAKTSDQTKPNAFDQMKFEEFLKDNSKVSNESGVITAKNGKSITLHGSSEVKGIIAGDGRRYLMDLMRLSPRDANFPDPTEHSTCLLRPELIKNYQVMKSLQRYYQKRAEKMQKQAQNKNTETTETPEKKEETIPKFELNPSLLTQVASSGPETESQLKDLENMGQYLLKEVLPAVFVELSDTQKRRSSIDCESLIKIMHRNGVNTRYLGHLLSLVQSKKQKFLENMILFTIFTRAFVKVCRETVTKHQEENPLEVMLHIINLILQELQSKNQIQKSVLPQTNITPHTQTKETISNSNTSKNKKKRKKKKKKATQPQNTTNNLQAFNWFQFVDPQTQRENPESYKTVTFPLLIEAVQNVAEKKYSLKSSLELDTILNTPHSLTRFLREIALRLGLKFKAQALNLSQLPLQKIKPKHLAGINCRFKAFHPSLEDIRYQIMAADREFKAGNFQKSLQILEIYISLAVSVYGFFHSEPILMLSKISDCLNRLKQPERALQFQTLGYVLALRVFGPHHPTTVHSLSSIGHSLYQNNRKKESASVHRFALKTLDLLSGKLNPASLECLSEMHIIAAEIESLEEREIILEELLSRTSQMYGKGDQRNLNWLNRLALLKSSKGEYEQAKLLQMRHSFILKQLIRAQEILEAKSKIKAAAQRKPETSQNTNQIESQTENGHSTKKELQDTKQKSESQTKSDEIKEEKIEKAKAKPAAVNYLQYYRLNLEHKFRESEKLKEFFKKKAENMTAISN